MAVFCGGLKQLGKRNGFDHQPGGTTGRRETDRSLTPPESLIIVFFVVLSFVMRMIAASETLASCIQLSTNLSARVLVGMHVHIRVPRTDGLQQLRKFTSGNSLTSRTNDACCRDDSFQLPGRRA